MWSHKITTTITIYNGKLSIFITHVVGTPCYGVTQNWYTIVYQLVLNQSNSIYIEFLKNLRTHPYGDLKILIQLKVLFVLYLTKLYTVDLQCAL